MPGASFSGSERRMRMGWRIVLTLLLLAVLAILSIIAGAGVQAATEAAPQTQSRSDPMVLAFYYPWFDESSWTYDKLSDLPQIPYASRDRSVMGRHIEQAQQAGIDAFVVAWYGPSGEFNQTEPNLRALLEEAAARNFKISILFETDSPYLNGTESVATALRYALDLHAAQSAYLRVDGQPVLFFWRPQVYDVYTWRNLRERTDPARNAIWISEGVDTSYLSVFDGHYLYSNTWNPPSDLTATNQKFAGRVMAAGQNAGIGKLWVATVMPGYNDLRVRPANGFAQDREGGAYYTRSWQAAIASAPNWVVITSFNEWPEGTYIEPSSAFGDQYLRLTASLSQQFKAGSRRGEEVPAPALAVAAAAPDPAVEPVQPSQQTTAALPEPTEPTAYVAVELLNVRQGPGTLYPIIDRIPAGNAYTITGRLQTLPDWWLIALDDGLGWIFGPLIDARGPLDNVPYLDVQSASYDQALGSPLPLSGQIDLAPFLSRNP